MNHLLIINKYYFLLLLTIITVFISCSNSENFKNAVIVKNNGKTFLELKGKRELMPHDPSSLLSSKTYLDSVMIEIPELKYGIIKGEDIPVEKGFHKYKGNLYIAKNRLIVSLIVDDTDSKTNRQFSWNGEYNLTNR